MGAGRGLIDFQPVGANLAGVGDLPLAVRFGEGGEADIGEAGATAADEDGRAVEDEPVDQPGG